MTAPPTRGRPVEPHRYVCLDCGVTMSTDNPVPDLIAMWKVNHLGHDVTEEHDDALVCAPAP